MCPHITRIALRINVDSFKGKERPMKSCIDWVKDVYEGNDEREDIDRDEWKWKNELLLSPHAFV